MSPAVGLLAAAAAIRAPSLFIDGEFEGYNEPALRGGAAYDIVRANTAAERITFPCSHYKVYCDYLAPARQAALEWFVNYL